MPHMKLLSWSAPVAFLIMWGSGAIFVKLGLLDASVWTFLAIRSVGAFLILGGICLYVFRRRLSASILLLPAALIMRMLLAGILLQVVYQGAFFLAIENGLSPGLLAIVLGLQPCLTSLLAREDVGMKGHLLLLLGFAGLGVSVTGARDVSSLAITGVVFAVVSVTAMSLGSVFQKRVELNPLVSALYQSMVAAVVFLIVALYVGPSWTPGPRLFFAASWMIVVVSVGATLLLLHMLSRGSAGSVSALFYLVPVVTMTFDYMVFGERVTLQTVIGSMLVVLSIVLFRKHLQARDTPMRIDGPRVRDL